jgi:DNA-binding LacI/PurR family transcriptional regulator
VAPFDTLRDRPSTRSGAALRQAQGPPWGAPRRRGAARAAAATTLSGMSDGRRRVGVRDVAQRAGVSTQTVSRVLNDYPGIRDDTRQRVLAAVADLDYRMNNAARALGTSRTRTVGVVASDTALYGPSAGIAALDAAARERGRWIATAYANADDESSVAAAVDHLLAQGVDGIVLVAPHVGTLASLGRAAVGVPVVSLHEETGGRQADGAALAVSHLAELGHRRVAELAGPSDWLEAAARAAGVERAVEEAGALLTDRWRGDWTASSGDDSGPTAVAVANDQMALGLIAGLTARGVDVPGSVSIVGFDDNPDAPFYTPSLTTVRIDVAGEARRAVGEVLGEPSSAPRPPLLVARDSTAAPVR